MPGNLLWHPHTISTPWGQWLGSSCNFQWEAPVAAEMWQCCLKDGFDGDATLELPLGRSHGWSRHDKPHARARDAHSRPWPSSLL